MTKLKKSIVRIIKKNKRAFLIVICIFLAILAAILYQVFKAEKKDENLIALYDIDKPIPVKMSEESFGFVDREGNVLIEADFIEVSDFYGEYAAVEYSNEEDVFSLINKKGEVLENFNSSTMPLYYSTYGVWLIDGGLYSKELKELWKQDGTLKYSSNGYFEYMLNEKKESGIINYEGKKVFSWDEDYITINISNSRNVEDSTYAAISNFEEREIIVNLETGKELFSLEDPKNEYIQKEADNIFRVISRENNFKTLKWIYIKDNKIVAELDDEDIYFIDVISFKDDILKIDYSDKYKNGTHKTRYVYYNAKRKEYLDNYVESYDKDEFNRKIYGYSIFKNEKYSLKNKKKTLLKDYDAITFVNSNLYKYMSENMNEHLCILEKDDKIYLFDAKKDKVIEEIEFASVTENPNSTFLTFTLFEDNGYTKKGYLIYNVVTKKSRKFDKDADIVVRSNSISIKDDKKIRYYNVDLKEVWSN